MVSRFAWSYGGSGNSRAVKGSGTATDRVRVNDQWKQ
jgi:hypothetical protein